MKNINDIKILSIEDNLHLHKTLENYGVNYILDSKSAYEKISSGWDDFDIVIIRPEMMSTVGKFAKLLGSRGKLPCPKCGTVVDEPHLLWAIRTIKKISKENKPNKAPAGAYNEELYQYVNKNGRVKVDEDRSIKEYQPVAKYLRREIMRTILNSNNPEISQSQIQMEKKKQVGAYYPAEALGKEKLMQHGKIEPKLDSKFAKDEPSVEIKKGQIRGTNKFEIENVILCEKVYGGRIGHHGKFRPSSQCVKSRKPMGNDFERVL